MDPNLLYWKGEGKSFLSRIRLWFNILDPSTLLSSNAEIETARVLIGSREKDNKTGDAWMLSLSAVHADSGDVIPSVFRPQALLPISAPLVVASLLPHSGVKPALFWQLLLQSYTTGFNYVHRNSSSEQGRKTSLKQVLLIVGTVSYGACAGAIPQMVIERLGMSSRSAQMFFRSVVPVPLSAALASLNVFIVRSEESENGIQAVRDTALSRAALFGTTAAIPSLLVFFLRKSRQFQKFPLLLAPMRHITTAIALGLMIPVSFSIFPQLGKIKMDNLEKELQAAAAVEGHLFYHRGL